MSYQLIFGTPLIDPAAYPELAKAGGRSLGVLLSAIRRLPRYAESSEAGSAELDALLAWSALHEVVSLLHSHAMKVRKIGPEMIDQPQLRVLHGISEALRSNGAAIPAAGTVGAN